MTRPSICVVLPTRERADTLASALKTCVSQAYEHLTILVCDNASQDHTRAVVESVTDPRIRYVNPQKRLSMSDNWEFALSHVDADFVTILGDDDGLMPGAIADLADLVYRHESPVISWQYGEYFWPSHADPERQNVLLVPMRNKLAQIDSRRALKQMFDFTLGYTRGPCIYYSLVAMEAVRKVIARDGRLFHSVVPDVYSSLALASVTDRYLYSTRPFSVAGASRHSTGSSHIGTRPGQNDHSSSSFVAENALKDPEFSQVRASMTAIILDSLLRFRECSRFNAPKIPVRRALRMVVSELKAVPGALDHNRALLEAAAARHGIEADLRSVLGNGGDGGGGAFVAARRLLGRTAPGRTVAFSGNHLRLDAMNFGAVDIAGACDLVSKVLGAYRSPDAVMEYSLAKAAAGRFVNRVTESNLVIGI